MDRTAITNVRSQATSIRQTTSHYLRAALATGNPDWPELLSSFHVVSRQFSDLSKDVDPVLNFFAYQPVKPTANAADIPTFLSTRPLKEMEAQPTELLGSAGEGAAPQVDKAAVDRYNQALQGLDDAYSSAAQSIMKSITHNRHAGAGTAAAAGGGGE